MPPKKIRIENFVGLFRDDGARSHSLFFLPSPKTHGRALSQVSDHSQAQIAIVSRLQVRERGERRGMGIEKIGMKKENFWTRERRSHRSFFFFGFSFNCRARLARSLSTFRTQSLFSPSTSLSRFLFFSFPPLIFSLSGRAHRCIPQLPVPPPPATLPCHRPFHREGVEEAKDKQLLF